MVLNQVKYTIKMSERKRKMPTTTARDLIGVEEIATMAGVSVPAVTQWRKKKDSDFPAPLSGYETLVFDKTEVEAWLKAKNKTFKPLKLEATLWAAADKLRGHMDPAEYKHVVLGLVFLKYISDAFEDRHRHLIEQENEGADPEDPDEYRAEGIFWVPPEARWNRLQAAAKQPEIGRLIDEAMEAIERENPSLKGVLAKDYARPVLDKRRLGELIDLISTIGLGGRENHARDVLGRVYEYFLGQFAGKEGKKAGEFYTPRHIVKLLVEMIEPYRGRVYDPCCGSSGMFVQSEEFIRAHGGRLGDISILGQESNPTTWRLANMNLAIRGIEANLGPYAADTFHQDLHPDLKADFILANPPFNMSDWGGEQLRDDQRWRYGVPPTGNANFAWVQHMIHHLSPAGIAGFVLANGSMSSNTSGEGEIRKNIIEGGLVDCMVALPGQLFYGTAIPACLWFISRDKSGKPTRGGKALRDRRGETLFIDARKLGVMVDRTHRELTEEDVLRISRTYHAWRGEKEAGEYEDVPGFCTGATTEEIRKHGDVLTPGRYVGAGAQEDDGEPFELKMERLVATFRAQRAAAAKLDEAITRHLEVFARGE
jgi:type I restriction enzyme M protein